MMNLTPGRIFEGRLAWKYFLSRQRTRCAGVISAGGFLAVVEVSHGPPKPNHGGLGMPGDDWPYANQPDSQSARLDVTGRFCRAS
jgi:hypothetical protein